MMKVSLVQQNTDNYNKWFLFTIAYLIIDYCRPQDLLPVLGYLRPALLMIVVLSFFLITNNGLSKSVADQTKMVWYFVILTAIYIPFARNNYWAYITTYTMLSFMPFFISTIVCVNTMDRLKKIINVYIFAAIYVAIYSLMHAGMGSGNYFQDENEVALFLNMWIPFCYMLLMHESNKKKKIFYLGGLIAGLLAIVVSFSRGGFVGLVCVAAVIWLYSPKKILSLIIVSILAAVVYLFGGEEYRNEIATISDTQEGTAHGRIQSWQAGWDMFLDKPLGVGGNNFQMNFQDYQPPEIRISMWGRVAHSLWFTLIPELGIFGIIIYFTLLAYNIRDIRYLKTFKNSDNKDLQYLYLLSIATLAALAGFFASATFLSVLYYPHYWYITALIVAMINISRELVRKQKEELEQQSGPITYTSTKKL